MRHLFWDCDPDELSWSEHSDFVIRRLLAEGGWSELSWLRERLGDQGLARWLTAHEGRGLTPRQLRFWQVVLRLEPGSVDVWVERARQGTWAARTHG
ncbi:MAG: hypothetical protein EP329_02495 [Deltaproteobacteria bacterium]|nr:MAG: hypothetical protein EP329_02495 [Deltaproteobacteria bacterium]